MYKSSTDYFWPSFNENATRIVGNWKDEKGVGLGNGPFGMKTSVKLDNDNVSISNVVVDYHILHNDFQCMVHRNWAKKDDDCSNHIKNCEDGYSFSIWEKNVYDRNTMTNYGLVDFKKKYIVSSGVEFDLVTATACPGFAIYRQGADLIGVVSTGTKVWSVTVVGQITENKWINIGIRWKYSDIVSTNDTNKDEVGIEMYINKELIARAALPIRNKEGNFDFTERKDCKIDGENPPVITLGCAWDRDAKQYDNFGNGEYDELAVWNRQLVKNETLDELPFFFGGYSKDVADIGAEGFEVMMDNVDLTDNNQAKIALDVLEAILIGPPTTQAAIPTRTADPNIETTTEEAEELVATTEQTTTTEKPSKEKFKQMADDQLSVQSAVSSILVQTHAVASCSPDEVQSRLAMATVAAKLLVGDNENVAKWQAVEETYPHEEGAPKTLRQMEWYMMDFVGCVNISAETSDDPFFDPKKRQMHYYTAGKSFGRYFDL